MSPTPWRIKADYLENCNCDLLCPCLFAVAPTESDCNVPIAYHIREGHYGTVQLDDLTVVRVTIFPGPGLMSSGNQKMALYIDERATSAQHDALVQIFSGKAGGPLERLQVLVTEFLGVRRAPITYTIDGPFHSVSIPDILDVVVEPAGGANPPREMVITNTRHACGPDLPVARGVRGTFRDHGFAWDNAGRTGTISASNGRSASRLLGTVSWYAEAVHGLRRAHGMRQARRRDQMKTLQLQRVPTLRFLSAYVLLGMWLGLSPAWAQERGGVLRIGMTAADIPFTGGIPDQGFEGYRFIGYPLYDALINWDLSQGERLSDLMPGLAESWEVRADDPTKWIFKLRRGVKFHDGTEFNADAVLWNWDKVRTKDAPQYDVRQAGFVTPRITVMQSWRKLDDYTVEFTTTRPSSFVPYQVIYVLYTSPTQWEKVGRDWRAFANNPAGTGPFKLTRLVPRERAELEPNQDYWDKTRIPRVDKVILLPMPEATTRLAALRTGQVEWIEVPPPDAIPALRQAGFQIFLRSYPHNWTHTLNLSRPPWDNKAVRQAANYAIDREGLCKSLLNDTCIPAIGEIYPGHPWFGNPTQRYEYNPTKARELLKRAGYDGKDKRVKASVLISTSGSGQMLPLPMNEYVQQNLRDVGIDLELVPIEWNALIARFLQGFQHPDNAQLEAMNASYNFLEPFSAFTRFFHSASVVPKSINIMPYINPEVDRLIEAAEAAFDPPTRDRLLAQVHEIIVDDAPWVFIVHDLNPRAMSPRVKGFVQPQSWFVDLTLPRVEK